MRIFIPNFIIFFLLNNYFHSFHARSYITWYSECSFHEKKSSLSSLEFPSWKWQWSKIPLLNTNKWCACSKGSTYKKRKRHKLHFMAILWVYSVASEGRDKDFLFLQLRMWSKMKKKVWIGILKVKFCKYSS